MSWLARSLVNSLRLDDDAENDVVPFTHKDLSPVKTNEEETQSRKVTEIHDNEEEEEESQARGVKEDLTELKKTLTRQLWGVASFLAPPPPMSSDQSVSNLNRSKLSEQSKEGEQSDSEKSLGIRQDFAEIGGRFRSGVTEISKIASIYFPFGSEENEESEMQERDGYGAGAIGITVEVLAFAKNIAMHPETWLDFPLDEEDDLYDFDISGAQEEHALAIERLAPRLGALRIELCPSHMTESYFWKVYFVLLHSRLDKHDAEILSTPQVMEARAMWMKELHKQANPENDSSERSNFNANDSALSHKEFESARTFDFEPTTSTATDYETEKHPVVSSEMQLTDSSVIEEKRVIKIEEKDPLAVQSPKTQVPNYEDDDNDWPDEEDSDIGSNRGTVPMGNDEDISFSDLEDDGNSTVPATYKTLSEGTET